MAFSYDNYTGNGATTQFSITFTYQNTSEISVTVDGVAETGLTFPSSSTVQLTSAPASGTLVQVRRTTDLTARAVDFASGSVLTEEDLDNSSIQTFHASQEAIDRANDAIALDDDDKWDAQNNVIKNVGTPTNANDATTKSYVDTSANNAASSAAAALVSQNASAASATASANSASASAGSATTSANEATDSANSATASAASAATATTQAALATSNGAAQVALATSQADNAASSATTAATQATLATTNGAAQVALATTQANNAASSASTAATQATASASSASTSAAQATNSANSATASANSASSASNAQTAAESARDATLAAYDNFDDRYLGTKSSAPTVDNDGDALVAGALYFDSVAGAMYVYTGSAWVAAYVSGTGFLALTGGTMSGDINFGDNDKAIFGSGSDLQVYHDAGNSRIVDAGTGNLNLQADNNINILNNAGTEFKAQFITGGAVNLFHANAKKFETTASGIDVTGTVVSDGLAVDGTAEIRSTGPTQLLIEDTDNGFAATTLSVENGGRDFHINTPQDIVLKQGGTIAQKIFTGGDISFYDNTGVTQGFYWDASTQRLGLGNTSPQKLLHLQASGGTTARFQSTGARVWDIGNDATTITAFVIDDVTAGQERFRITSDGSIGIGSQSPSQKLTVEGTANNQNSEIKITASGVASGYLGSNSDGLNIGTDSHGIVFKTGVTGGGSVGATGSERMRIDSSGNVGIGTASPATTLDVQGGNITQGATGSNAGRFLIDNTTDTIQRLKVSRGGASGQLAFHTGADSEAMRINSSGNVGIGTTATTGAKLKVDGGATAGTIIQAGNAQGGVILGAESSTAYVNTTSSTPLAFEINNSEKMRIDSSGRVLTFKTTSGLTNAGVEHNFTNAGGYLGVTSEAIPVYINRAPSDGGLIHFRQNNNQEGSISVSGTTVSYNGGHLSRWSQLADNTRDGSIVKGTVMTNLDQMAEWTNDGVTEDNEQLNCMAVSTVEGDPNVAGVFVNWDNDDDIYTNDMNVAMTGDMIIRIAQGTTVTRGDLLMSAGDGTAKPQGDDIIRNKTIAKVTSTNVSHIYDDGSYCVPCVLMAC